MAVVKGNIIRFDASDFLSGLSPQYVTSLSAAPDYFSGQLNLASAFNPYRFLGYAAPGFDPTDLTTVSVMTGLGRNVTMASESAVDYAYIICDNNQINRLVVSTKTFSNAGSWPHTIAATGTETGNDIITYNENIGSASTSCVFYSYNDSGGTWNIGLFNTSSGAFDDDWFTTIPASPITPAGNNKPHPMIIGADDVLYVGDGNKVHGLDGATGANGTAIDTAFLLPAGYIITSFTKDSRSLNIFAYYSPSGNSVAPSVTTSGPSICVKWNYLDEDASEVIPISDNVVTAGFTINGSVGCFTQGTKPVNEGENRFCTIQMFNGTVFETKQLFIGNAPIHGGVDVVDGSVQWNSDGAVHCWGSPLVGTPAGLNKLGKGSGTSNGLLRTIGGTTGFQLISSGTTTSGGAQYFKIATFTSATLLQTAAVAPLFPLGTWGKIKRVVVTYGRTSTSGGREMNIILVKEDATTITIASAVTEVTAAAMTKQFDRTSGGATLGTFQDLSLVLQWTAGLAETSAPVVRSVDVEFETVNLVGNS